jgi:hypothetical protein
MLVTVTDEDDCALNEMKRDDFKAKLAEVLFIMANGHPMIKTAITGK